MLVRVCIKLFINASNAASAFHRYGTCMSITALAAGTSWRGFDPSSCCNDDSRLSAFGSTPRQHRRSNSVGKQRRPRSTKFAAMEKRDDRLFTKYDTTSMSRAGCSCLRALSHLVHAHASISKLLCNRNRFSPFLIGFRGDIDLYVKQVVIVDAIDCRV